MRVLIAGAAGFPGSYLADRLPAEGHEVVGNGAPRRTVACRAAAV